jgi:hypothetical protein
LAILPTRQLSSVCLADHPELNTAENTDPAARGFCSSGSGTGSDRQHRTVCGLRHAAKQASSDQSAFFLLVRVQFLWWPRRWERILPWGHSWTGWRSQHQLPQHGTRMRTGVLHCTALHCAALHVRSGKFMHRCCWMLAVGYWLLDIGCCNLDHRSKFMLNSSSSMR